MDYLVNHTNSFKRYRAVSRAVRGTWRRRDGSSSGPMSATAGSGQQPSQPARTARSNRPRRGSSQIAPVSVSRPQRSAPSRCRSSSRLYRQERFLVLIRTQQQGCFLADPASGCDSILQAGQARGDCCTKQSVLGTFLRHGRFTGSYSIQCTHRLTKYCAPSSQAMFRRDRRSKSAGYKSEPSGNTVIVRQSVKPSS